MCYKLRALSSKTVVYSNKEIITNAALRPLPREDAIFMQKTNNLQDILLNRARIENMPVTVFLTNGFQLKGVVRGFDCFIVVLDTEGRQQIIYKHAISTIIPARPIRLDGADNTKEDAR